MSTEVKCEVDDLYNEVIYLEFVQNEKCHLQI